MFFSWKDSRKCREVPLLTSLYFLRSCFLPLPNVKRVYFNYAAAFHAAAFRL